MGWGNASSALRIAVWLCAAAGYYAQGQPACLESGFNFNDVKCGEGWEELWKEVVGPQTNRMCCNPKDKDYDQAVRFGKGVCRPTECLSSSAFGGSTCSSFYDRYKMDNKLLSYDEILRESCTSPYGSPGVVGLCCEKGSVEGALATASGSEPNEFPHMAKMRSPFHCGATVYNKQWLITAAHCTVDPEGHPFDPALGEVVLGSNIGTVESPEFVYKVKRFIPYPEYSGLNTSTEFQEKKGNARIFNDIALMELDREIQFGRKIKALEIAPKTFIPQEYSDKVVIVGWGTTDNLELSQYLQKSNLAIRNDSRCFDSKEPHMWVQEKMGKGFEKQMLCVGGIVDGKYSPTARKGDSGGPAICRGKDGRIVLCGVTSFGGMSDVDCAKFSDAEHCTPSVYAEVAYFHDWIKSVAGEQENGTLHKPFLYGEPVSSEKEQKYLHQVHITSSDGKPCGGTLVAPNFVVTAAQCVAKPSDGQRFTGIKVTSGITDLNENGTTYGVMKLVTLPGYGLSGPPVNITAQGNHVRLTDSFFTNDLAVLKLARNVNISSITFPVFPDHFPEFGSELSFPRPTQTNPGTKLRSRHFRFLGHGDCQTRMDRLKHGFNITVDRNLLCGVETYSGGSTCDRELGGGVICKGPGGKEQLCGVQVFRFCESSIPNGFMNMVIFKDFVRRAMEQLSEGSQT